MQKKQDLEILSEEDNWYKVEYKKIKGYAKKEYIKALNSENSNISETFSTYLQNDFVYDTNYFTQNLETFTALTFLSDGNKIYAPKKLHMFPHFKTNGL